VRRIEEFPTFYQSELLPHLQELEGKRKELASRLWKTGLGIVGALLVLGMIAAGFMAGRGPGGSPFFFIPFFGMVLGGIIFAMVYGRMIKGFVAEFKDRIIGKIVQFVEPGLSYHKNDCIRQPAYMSSKIFLTRPDRYKGEDLVRGMIGATAIEFSEIHSEYRSVSTDSKGRRRETWHTIFRGIFFSADFNKHFHGETVVLPDRAEKLFGRLGQALQSMNIARKGSLVRLEDVAFEKRFVVYSDDQVEARYLLSTSLMERIMEFANRTGREIYLSFVDSKLHVAIPYNKNLFEPKLFSTLLNMQLSQEYLEDLLLAATIVEDLNLNTRIWSKQ
jgi:hypothetical protein